MSESVFKYSQPLNDQSLISKEQDYAEKREISHTLNHLDLRPLEEYVKIKKIIQMEKDALKQVTNWKMRFYTVLHKGKKLT